MEVIARSERRRGDLANLVRLYAKTTDGSSVGDYLRSQNDIYTGWCSATMSTYLRKYSPEAGVSLKSELECVSTLLDFIGGMYPEYKDDSEALRRTIQKCKAFHRQWLTNTYSLRRKTRVPKKFLC